MMLRVTPTPLLHLAMNLITDVTDLQYIVFKGLGNDTNIQNSILTQDNWSTINQLLFKLTNLDIEKAV